MTLMPEEIFVYKAKDIGNIYLLPEHQHNLPHAVRYVQHKIKNDAVISQESAPVSNLAGEELPYVQTVKNGMGVWLRIGHQSFRLAAAFDDEETKDQQQEWYLNQLKTALDNLTTHVICNRPADPCASNGDGGGERFSDAFSQSVPTDQRAEQGKRSGSGIPISQRIIESFACRPLCCWRGHRT